jgi:peptide/nickel transport system substrate-binding protein
VLSVLALAAVLTGCGGGNSGAAGVPTQTGEADAGVHGVRAPSTRTGGTLRLVTGEIDSLDPQRSYTPAVWNLMRLYARTLVTYSAKPGHTDELVPDLATDL